MLWSACYSAVKMLGVVKDLGGEKGEVSGVTQELSLCWESLCLSRWFSCCKECTADRDSPVTQ